MKCPPDYRLWLQSIYVVFGKKWLNLYSGPIRKVVGTGQEGAHALSTSRRTENVRTFYVLLFIFSKFIEERVNIPALSVRTIERDIASSVFTVKAGIQV